MSWTTRGREFIGEVRAESAKVSWPTRDELRDSTIVVIVTVILLSIFIGVVDRILNAVIALMFR